MIEQWLREEVGAAYDAVKSGAQKTYPAGLVFDEIRARHTAAKDRL